MQGVDWRIIAAFAVIYLVWGSTYLANFWAIATIPPFLMGGVRFLTAGSLLYAYTLTYDRSPPTRRQVRNAAGIGFLFLTCGTGTVVWAEQFIDTSLVALLIAFEPLLIMLLLWALLGSRPSRMAWVGAGVSIVGVCLLVGQPRISGTPESLLGLAAILFGMACWAVGSIYIGRLDMGKNRFRATAMQMLTAGVTLLLISLPLQEWDGFAWPQVSLTSWLCLVYLIFFGAILAFSCFNFLLSRVSPEKVATSTYVNPVVALLLGVSLNNEALTVAAVVAGALMLTGVWFINSAR